MSFIIIFLNVLLTFILLWNATKNKRLIQYLPTLCWFSFIIIPLIFSWTYFPVPARNMQAIGATLISIALAIGDRHGITKEIRPLRNFSQFKYQKILVSALVFILILIPIYHYYKVGYIPLLNRLFGDYSPIELRDQRENFNKFALPFVFSVISNHMINIVAPLLIGILSYLKKYYLSVSVFFWVVFYSLSSNQKGSFIVFVSSVLMVLAFLQTEKQRNILAKLFGSAFLATILFGILHSNSMIKNVDRCPLPIGANYSPANINRSCEKVVFDEIKTFFVIDSIGYRIFLTPVEVSNNWYRYYSEPKNSFRSVSDLLDRNLSSSAANRVGIEYYQRIFPDRYGTSVSAYSSIDSDAYSFGGLFLVFLVAIVLLIIRLSISAGIRSNFMIARILFAIGLTHITLMPWQSSIQAILFSQGLFLIILLIFLSSKIGNSERLFFTNN